MRAAVSRLAPAKINLTLHVTGQREDGYHLLDSLVVFAEAGDLLTLRTGPGLSLDLIGPCAAALAPEPDNLVLRAARLTAAQGVAFTLDKQLPVASGMGGGSSDAAAALHLLAEARDLPLPGTEALMRLGADMPVCMAAPAPQRMRGLGERVDPVAGIPALWLLLVNPGQGLSTPAVFKAMTQRRNPAMPDALPDCPDAESLCAWLAGMRNDLQAPAIALMPQIEALLADIGAQNGCLLARMTGSGATCFGIFTDETAMRAAATALSAPGRFILPTRSLPSP
ncbi:4-(cytidine 5'-diphospho)-2-C-methyl-D-erythritol kinase [Pararhodobacter zhoushanensis]|uniref:4-diphosphocytidyl-2-C-methyl-D-erythritol kinase n=1 Tax=Pararhodobacter zhoushanensis TaxID=2479545 RepID=A0ABT3GWG7_9RHOB|nr:4-(cytidine 5'-diphospho)-2-C-methyl-D-erythritol kinase [Pararhodobacter zhoushanensis]MCW1931893.1 4-(cytidine 5'-diphospho)-2-C-methyl-D-erythritol kinase [Pararhodobacter zhoushanensis]